VTCSVFIYFGIYFSGVSLPSPFFLSFHWSFPFSFVCSILFGGVLMRGRRASSDEGEFGTLLLLRGGAHGSNGDNSAPVRILEHASDRMMSSSIFSFLAALSHFIRRLTHPPTLTGHGQVRDSPSLFIYSPSLSLLGPLRIHTLIIIYSTLHLSPFIYLLRRRKLTRGQ
jgi:hypothetical protein